jgi:acyl-coenzyme A synthetase/AMP-(fatty) acid ligase
MLSQIIGMVVALQLTIYLNNTLVADPLVPGPPNPVAILETLRHGRVDTALLPPSLIDALCSNPAGLEALRNLKTLYFGGAPLSAKTAALLAPHTNVMPAFGSTEAGMYFTRHHADGEDWEYFSFHECMGLEFRHVSDELYELVFVKKEGLERYQHIFQVYPELREFSTKDLFTPHPSKPDRWKYVGRADDMIVFSHGKNLHATGVEEAIAQHPGVVGVLVAGQGRAKPFVLVEWHDSVAEKTVEAIWPTIEKVNEGMVVLVRLERDFVMAVGPEKKLARTAKGTVARRENEVLFKEEIDALYH